MKQNGRFRANSDSRRIWLYVALLVALVLLVGVGLLIDYQKRNEAYKVAKAAEEAAWEQKINEMAARNKTELADLKRKYPDLLKPVTADPYIVKNILRQLFGELNAFKDDPEFHRVGFGRSGRYYRWLERAQGMQGRGDQNERVIAGDLVQLGMSYGFSRGRETDYTRFASQEIQKGLGR